MRSDPRAGWFERSEEPAPPWRALLGLPPSFALRDSHIWRGRSKPVAGNPIDEAVEAACHGFGARRFVVAVPAAEPRRDPGQPSERALLVRVFLAWRGAFERCGDRKSVV